MHSRLPVGGSSFHEPVGRDLRSTGHLETPFSPRMRDIDGEALREHVVRVAQHAEMRDKLHFVLSVVHKSLVEARQRGRALDEHVGLLDVVEHAGELAHVGVGGQVEPVVGVVVLDVRERGRDDVCVGGLSETETEAVFDTATELLFVSGE